MVVMLNRLLIYSLERLIKLKYIQETLIMDLLEDSPDKVETGFQTY